MIWQPARLTAVRSTIYMYNQDNATAYQSPICWGFTHIPAPYQFLKLVKCDVAVFWAFFTRLEMPLSFSGWHRFQPLPKRKTCIWYAICKQSYMRLLWISQYALSLQLVCNQCALSMQLVCIQREIFKLGILICKFEYNCILNAYKMNTKCISNAYKMHVKYVSLTVPKDK